MVACRVVGFDEGEEEIPTILIKLFCYFFQEN